MTIIRWFRTIGNRVRMFFIGLGLAISNWWQGLNARVRTLFRRRANDKAELTADSAIPPTSGAAQPQSGGRFQQMRARLHALFAPIGAMRQRIRHRIGPFVGALFRRNSNRPELAIRKIEIKRAFQYNRDRDEFRQLAADIANLLLIVIGMGMWPYLLQWATRNLSPALAPQGWVIALLLGMLPLVVVYRRWHYIRQTRSGVDWDILTGATALIGIAGLLFAILLLLTAWTSFALQAGTVVCALIATVTWLFAEGVNLYAILIRRPYTLGALLSLSKSLLFLLTGWLILIYLPLVTLWAGTIQLESATFLLIIFVAAAVLGLLTAIIRYVVVRFHVRLPRFAS